MLKAMLTFNAKGYADCAKTISITFALKRLSDHKVIIQ